MNFLIKAHDRASRVFKKVGDAAGKLSGAVDKTRAAGKFTAIGGAAAAATPHLLALGTALAKVGPATATLVPALLAGGAALATLKLAMAGMSDALSNLGRDADSTKQFQEALKGLAPNARNFAIAVRRVAPAFTDLRKAVQNAAFAGLAAQIKPLTANLLPTLRRGLVGVAQAGATAASGLAAFLRTGQAKSLLATTLQGIVTAFKGMSGIPAKLGKALLQIAVAAMPGFQRLTAAMTGFFAKFAEKVNSKSAAGKLTAMVNDAIDTLAQLGRIAGNVGRVIGGIFKAAGDGGGILGTIERITKAIANAVNSKKGQEVLQKVFEMMSKAGPIIAIAGGLAYAFGAIGGVLVSLIGPITAIAAASAPVLAITAGVAVALAALAAGAIVVGAALVVAYTKSAAFREIVAGLAGKLRELWDLFVAKGLPVLKDFAANALGAAIAGFNNIRDAIQRNKPELEQLWAGLKKVAAFVMAAWPTMSAVAVGTLKGIFAGITAIIGVIGVAVRMFNMMKAGVIGAAVAMLGAFSMILGALAKFAGAMSKIPGLGALWRPVVNAAHTAKNAVDGVSNAIRNVPRHIQLTVGISGTSAAYATLNQLSARARAGADARASGGPVRKGQPYIVGEKRPELFIPNTSGRIVPRVPAMSGGGGGGGTVRVVFEDRGGESLFLSAIRQMVWVEGGGNVQLAFGKAGR